MSLMIEKSTNQILTDNQIFCGQ